MKDCWESVNFHANEIAFANRSHYLWKCIADGRAQTGTGASAIMKFVTNKMLQVGEAMRMFSRLGHVRQRAVYPKESRV